MVIQDIGIARFLMLLWKDTYGPDPRPFLPILLPPQPQTYPTPQHRLPKTRDPGVAGRVLRAAS